MTRKLQMTPKHYSFTEQTS